MEKESKIRFGLEQVDKVVEDFVLPRVGPGVVIAFTGMLGAGKTTLCKSILRQMGVTINTPSPTFGYVRLYDLKKSFSGVEQIAHFDLYRVANVEELESLGLFELITSEKVLCLVEWPELIFNTSLLENKKGKIFSFKLLHDITNFQDRIIEIN